MEVPFNTMVIVSGASAAATAAVFCGLYVAFRIGLGRQSETTLVQNEGNVAERYFGRMY